MKLLWIIDRATALVAYPSLFCAVLTGIFFSPKAKNFGRLHRTARRIHVEVSVFATIMMLAHGVLGTIDSGLVLTGSAPAPPYPLTFFIGGIIVGYGALALLIVAILGFMDARRFSPPWDARVVHSFAYAGFSFATIHAVALGTDITGIVRAGLIAAMMFIAWALALRLKDTYDIHIRERPEPENKA